MQQPLHQLKGQGCLEEEKEEEEPGTAVVSLGKGAERQPTVGLIIFLRALSSRLLRPNHMSPLP